MIALDTKSSKIQDALKLHTYELKVWLNNRIERIEDELIRGKLKVTIQPFLEEILCSKPDNLIELNNIIEPEIIKYKDTIEKVFNYKYWSEKESKVYGAYELADNLDVETCVYCNRLYTKCVVGKKNKIIRPQFDHWFPKKDFPLLALSFYNLIPSCNVCNSNIKGKVVLDLNDYFHPYMDDNVKFKFSYWLKSKKEIEFNIKTKDTKARNTIELFQLHEIYKSHKEELIELLETKKRYGTTYLNSLRKLIKNDISKEEIYRLAFGVYMQEGDFVKRPLSKFKRDILSELGII